MGQGLDIGFFEFKIVEFAMRCQLDWVLGVKSGAKGRQRLDRSGMTWVRAYRFEGVGVGDKERSGTSSARYL